VIGSDPGVRFVGVLRIKERVVGAVAGGPWLVGRGWGLGQGLDGGGRSTWVPGVGLPLGGKADRGRVGASVTRRTAAPAVGPLPTAGTGSGVPTPASPSGGTVGAFGRPPGGVAWPRLEDLVRPTPVAPKTAAPRAAQAPAASRVGARVVAARATASARGSARGTVSGSESGGPGKGGHGWPREGAGGWEARAPGRAELSTRRRKREKPRRQCSASARSSRAVRKSHGASPAGSALARLERRAERSPEPGPRTSGDDRSPGLGPAACEGGGGPAQEAAEAAAPTS
jgi:hypothetical protein